MIRPEQLYNQLHQHGIDFYTGVPDSLLKDFLTYVQVHAPADKHIITANEGLAIGLAAGYHFSTGKLPVVYLQNSGLGNIINPLTSLADKEMYAVPMLMMIGWRGRPGVKDEPQHQKMGRITVALLEALEVPYFIINENEKASFEKMDEAISIATNGQMPVALIFPENVFEAVPAIRQENEYSLERGLVIKEIIDQLAGTEIVVCTTGKIGREFYAMNELAGNKITKYLLCAGAMGHANHIALGINVSSVEKVIMLDGDGALLMHLGGLSTIAHHSKAGFVHMVINNGCHESVGGQPTGAFLSDLCGIAAASGYSSTTCINTSNELQQWLTDGLQNGGKQFVEIRVNTIGRKDLGRPAGTPAEWKNNFSTAYQKSK